MNMSHSNVTDWGLKHVPIEKRFTILDVGCGGGRTIQKLAAIVTEGMLYGVDYLRVLKPGGTLIIIAESYKGGRYDKLHGPVMRLLRSTLLSVDEHRELFSKAGYIDVQTFEDRKKGCFCGTGKKPL